MNNQERQSLIDEANYNLQHCFCTEKTKRLMQIALTNLYNEMQSAPVVPEEATPDTIEILASARRRDQAVFQWDEDQRNAAADSWNACRAAMLQAQSDDDGEPTDDERIMAIEGIHNCERCSDEGWVIGEMGITPCICRWNGSYDARKSGNSPVVPDGYVMVPKEVTLEIGNAINEVGHHCTCGNCSQRLWDLLLAAAPQEVNHG